MQGTLTLPKYIEKDDFKDFLAANNSELQPNNSGYIVILTDKESYHTGELVRGTVLCDLFAPTKQQDIFIKFKGEQCVPKRMTEAIDQRINSHLKQERDDEY